MLFVRVLNKEPPPSREQGTTPWGVSPDRNKNPPRGGVEIIFYGFGGLIGRRPAALRNGQMRPFQRAKALSNRRGRLHELMDNTDSKVCSRCDARKPLTEFRKRSDTPDGLQYLCRECHDAPPVSAGELLREARAEADFAVAAVRR